MHRHKLNAFIKKNSRPITPLNDPLLPVNGNMFSRFSRIQKSLLQIFRKILKKYFLSTTRIVISLRRFKSSMTQMCVTYRFFLP